MTTINVLLPDQMRDWVEIQVRNGQYGDASDYVRDLIRHDQVRSDKLAELQMLVTAGLESGVSDRSKDDILAIARQRASVRRT